tara:strand:- start:511 stop:1524 length:1014 start_codon:yes stop_codon:yes gene_type:complete
MNSNEIENKASGFTIGFDHRDRSEVHNMWDEIFDTQQWSEGRFTKEFETLWSDWNGIESVSFSSWAGGAMAALDFIDVKNETVLCPSNTFMATPLSVINSGGNVQFVDCNKNDLCMSFDDFREKAEKFKPKAVWVVHIGGHIAFDIEKISNYCKENNIFLLEDCAHAHGAEWNGMKPGCWGDAGIYSMYATKTISTGEGGILASSNKKLINHSIKFRNYGKFEHLVDGLNYRMSEFTAALGVVQTKRLPEIVSWKNSFSKQFLDPNYPNRVVFPEGMISGYYKYIVFDELEKSTGKVYDDPCHNIMKHDIDLPNTDWVSKNHWCVPLYYHPDIEVNK